MASTAQQYPVSAGFNQNVTGNFIPEIFSLKLLARYYEDALTPKIVNTDYEGEIKKIGDRVNIRRDPEATVRRYFAGMTLIQQQTLDTQVELLINNGAYWNIPVDDIQKRQADVPWVNRLESNAAIQQRRYVDQQVLGSIYADAAAANIVANTTVIANNLPQIVVNFRQLLRQAFSPEDEAGWIVCPYWFEALFVLNPSFIRADVMGDGQSMIRSGLVGKMMGFEIYGSPNLTTTGGYIQVIFGNKLAVTFAAQFIFTETLRNPLTFGDLIRGLQVFGWKTVQSQFLGVIGSVQG